MILAGSSGLAARDTLRTRILGRRFSIVNQIQRYHSLDRARVTIEFSSMAPFYNELAYWISRGTQSL